MKLTCPKCGAEIPLDDVNVSQDVALCRHCAETFSFVELSQDNAAAGVDILRPPAGAWHRSQGNEFEVGATTRSWMALFFVPFTLVWSGGSLGGIYGRQIIKHTFNPTLSLFGIPFLLFSLPLVSMALMTLFGKVLVHSSGDLGRVFLGVGPFGWTRKFRWSEIKRVRLSQTNWRQNGQTMPVIEIEGPKPIRFGSGLSAQRRDFMLAVLRRHATGRF